MQRSREVESEGQVLYPLDLVLVQVEALQQQNQGTTTSLVNTDLEAGAMFQSINLSMKIQPSSKDTRDAVSCQTFSIFLSLRLMWVSRCNRVLALFHAIATPLP